MKRNYSHITSLEALKAEQLKLKRTYEQQGAQLQANVEIFVKQFTVGRLIKSALSWRGVQKLDDKVHFSGKLMSLVLPFFLNKTLFKSAGFITKGLVALASNKLGRQLDMDHITGIIDRVKDWIGSSSKKKQRKIVDYGIPPDSETY